jgi:hypothetical protein
LFGKREHIAKDIESEENMEGHHEKTGTHPEEFIDRFPAFRATSDEAERRGENQAKALGLAHEGTGADSRARHAGVARGSTRIVGGREPDCR